MVRNGWTCFNESALLEIVGTEGILAIHNRLREGSLSRGEPDLFIQSGSRCRHQVSDVVSAREIRRLFQLAVPPLALAVRYGESDSQIAERRLNPGNFFEKDRFRHFVAVVSLMDKFVWSRLQILASVCNSERSPPAIVMDLTEPAGFVFGPDVVDRGF
jgi:hypothetical protein